jgi:hypothetical protein
MKFAVPGTYVPGAIPTGTRDNRGRPQWQMPKPVAFVERIQVVKEVVMVDDKPRMVKVRKPVEFPVYRGMAANLARNMRAQMRRNQRKMAEASVLKDLETGYCDG